MKQVALMVLLLASIWSKAQENEHYVDYYDENQTKKRSEGDYFYGRENGTWKFWYRNGQLKEEANFIEGMLNGSVVYYYESGQKEKEGYFWYDKPDSLFQEWYSDGRLKSKGSFNRGMREGVWEYYYPDGTLWKREEVKNGVTYFKALNSREGKKLITNGKGALVYYHDNGAIKEQTSIENGLRNGESIEFFASGKKKVEGDFTNGFASGEWVYWYENGNKEKVQTVKDSVLDGRSERYFQNGQLDAEGNYAKGKKEHQAGTEQAIKHLEIACTKWSLEFNKIRQSNMTPEQVARLKK